MAEISMKVEVEEGGGGGVGSLHEVSCQALTRVVRYFQADAPPWPPSVSMVCAILSVEECIRKIKKVTLERFVICLAVVIREGCLSMALVLNLISTRSTSISK